MTVRYAEGHEAPEYPSGWWVTHAGWCCLHCRRARVAERSLEAAGITDRERDPRAGQVQREALTDFELRRDPSRPNAVIAKIAAATPHAVKDARKALVEAGEIPAYRQPPLSSSRANGAEPGRLVQLWERIDAALLADPSCTNRAVVKALGTSAGTVARRRRKLEASGAIPSVERRGGAAK